MEERFDRMENMLGQLITMVGAMSKEQKEMKADITAIKEEQILMKADIADIKEEQASMKADIAHIKDEQTSMKADITAIKEEQTLMKADIAHIKDEQTSMKAENEDRHVEVLKMFSTMEADHTLIWGKAVNNERDIAKMKTHVFPHNNF
ncbi:MULTISPECIES: hypothetical protein [Paraliobacillus]|uniref:hypothetical protein n=1 Tax=Paraliobacillus TaxID=200903 RepID=UPI000DD49C7E|nr:MULTISPECIES: hypothetical protein [Paraliobacillus]